MPVEGTGPLRGTGVGEVGQREKGQRRRQEGEAKTSALPLSFLSRASSGSRWAQWERPGAHFPCTNPGAGHVVPRGGPYSRSAPSRGTWVLERIQPQLSHSRKFYPVVEAVDLVVMRFDK